MIGQFYEAMEDAFAYKKTLAMFNTERAILRDTASVNFWFPKMKDMVIVPLFEGSITSKKMARSEVIVNRDFVYTVLNHIRTYQAKALTYQNVLSFVESIRSRVIINGVTARSEWDVDKAILQPIYRDWESFGAWIRPLLNLFGMRWANFLETFSPLSRRDW